MLIPIYLESTIQCSGETLSARIASAKSPLDLGPSLATVVVADRSPATVAEVFVSHPAEGGHQCVPSPLL